ncbi:MAG: NAD(P)/FAD-dependent oxidoreductase [Candidatus Thiodiazotropha endolucinida]
MNNDHYDAIVVGSGLGGLTAGALYARRGKRVLVLERHDKFGGAATVFNRMKMRIEAGLHEIDGLGENDIKDALWQELGLSSLLEPVSVGSLFAVLTDIQGPEFVIPEGMDNARVTFTRRFPQHAESIRRYFRVIRQIHTSLHGLTRIRRDRSAWKPWLWPQLMRHAWTVLQYNRTNLGEFLQSLFGNDEDVKKLLCCNIAYYTHNPTNLSLMFYSAAQASYHEGGGHYIRGGSQALSNALVAIIEEAGGEALRRRQVSEILIEKERVSGVAHEYVPSLMKERKGPPRDIQLAFAPVIFGNAAPHVLMELLPAEMRQDFFAPYRGREVSTSLWSLFLGFDCRPADFGVSNYSTFMIPKCFSRLDSLPEMVRMMSQPPPGTAEAVCVFVDYDQIESGLNNDGRYLGVICGLDSIDNWLELDDKAYDRRRNAWADALVAQLDSHFPGIARHVVYQDLATARTCRRFLNTPRGAVYGFVPPLPFINGGGPDASTPVAGLYLASAFGSHGGGFTGAMLSGEQAAKQALGEV